MLSFSLTELLKHTNWGHIPGQRYARLYDITKMDYEGLCTVACDVIYGSHKHRLLHIHDDPEYASCAAKNGDIELLHFILLFIDNYKPRVLENAFKFGHLNIIKYLMDQYAYPWITDHLMPAKKIIAEPTYDMQMEAVMNGHLPVVKWYEKNMPHEEQAGLFNLAEDCYQYEVLNWLYMEYPDIDMEHYDWE